MYIGCNTVLKITLFFHRFRQTWFFHTRSLPFVGTYIPQSKRTQLLGMVPGLKADSGKHWEPSAQITPMRIADKRLLMHSGSSEKMKLFTVNPSLLWVWKCLQINFWKQLGAFSLNLNCLLLQESWSWTCVTCFFIDINKLFQFSFFQGAKLESWWF